MESQAEYPIRRSAGTLAEPGGDRSDRFVRFLTACVFSFSVAFFAVVTTISHLDPGFFDRMLIEDIQSVEIDPIMVGATTKPAEEIQVEAMPVERVVRATPLQPSDFSIVMVFGEEAHLASPGELWRVKTGSIVPGLGKVLAVEENENGGTIKTENAVLTGVPN